MRIVRHHHNRRSVESVYEKAGFFVQGEACGSSHGIETARLEPRPRCIQQRASYAIVADGFEQAKESNLVLVYLQLQLIANRGNPADDFTVPSSKKELDRRMLMKRML